MKSLSTALVIALSAITATSHAESDDNNCSKLNIIVTNSTSEGCRLVSSNLKHGFLKFTSSIPMFIPAHSSSSPVFITQSIFGPELELTYTCGDNRLVTINSKQNVCVLYAGNIYGQVTSAINMSANYQSILGSWLWSQHGSIQWNLE